MKTMQMKTLFLGFLVLLMLVGCGGDSDTSPSLDDDKAKLRLYGACKSIHSASNWSINKQRGWNDPSLKLVLDTNAHRASVYALLSYQIVQKYPETQWDELLEISNDYMNNNILGRNIDLSMLRDMERQTCDWGLISPLVPELKKAFTETQFQQEYQQAYSMGR